MSNIKIIKEAIDHLKTYRTAASEANSVHLELIAKIVRVATEANKKNKEDRTNEEEALLQTFTVLSDDVDKSLKAIDDYNKSVESYMKGFKLLAKVISNEVGSNSNVTE